MDCGHIELEGGRLKVAVFLSFVNRCPLAHSVAYWLQTPILPPPPPRTRSLIALSEFPVFAQVERDIALEKGDASPASNASTAASMSVRHGFYSLGL